MIEQEIYDNDRPLEDVLYDFELYLHKKFKKSSAIVYLCCVKRFFKLGGIIDNPQSYVDFILENRQKKIRADHYKEILIKFVNYINIRKDVKKYIISSLKEIKKDDSNSKKQTLILSREQRFQIINNMKYLKHKVIGIIQEETGGRAGDVLRLKRGKIKYTVDNDIIAMVFYMTGKANKDRTIFVYNQQSIKFIQNFIRNHFLHKDYYFLSDKNVKKKNDILAIERRNYVLYMKDLKETCKRLGYDPSQFTSHDIRRNYAVEMFPIVGNNIEQLRQLMGHSSVNTTAIYLKKTGLDTKDYQRKRLQ